jgi:predicted dienelactone hydrolase
MHEAVASEITDGQRASQLNQAINGLEAELLSFGTLFDRFQSAVRTLNARPDSTRVEFEALCEKFEAQRIAARTRVAQFHFEMIAATTPAEWHELASHESAALTATER